MKGLHIATMPNPSPPDPVNPNQENDNNVAKLSSADSEKSHGSSNMPSDPQDELKPEGSIGADLKEKDSAETKMDDNPLFFANPTQQNQNKVDKWLLSADGEKSHGSPSMASDPKGALKSEESIGATLKEKEREVTGGSEEEELESNLSAKSKKNDDSGPSPAPSIIETDRVDQNVANHPEIQIVIRKLNMNDLKRLQPGYQVNGNLINHWFGKLEKRSRAEEDLPSVCALDTVIYTLCKNQEYKALKVHSGKKPIFDSDMVIIPINKDENHWCLCLVDLKKEQCLFYDSLGHKGMDIMITCMNYLMDQHWVLKKEPFKCHNYSLISVEDTPRQQNSVDCGVFLLLTAEKLTAKLPLDFSQDDIDNARRTILSQIIWDDLGQKK